MNHLFHPCFLQILFLLFVVVEILLTVMMIVLNFLPNIKKNNTSQIANLVKCNSQVEILFSYNNNNKNLLIL